MNLGNLFQIRDQETSKEEEECALGPGPLRRSSSEFLGQEAGEGKPN